MAYIFPISPVDGQLYPTPAIPGSLQYIWNQGQNAWLIYSPLGVQSVSGVLPIVVTNNSSNPVVSIQSATISRPGTMSPEDKAKVDALPTVVGTVVSVGAEGGLSTNQTGNAPITTSGVIRLLPPSGGTIGGVKAGPNIIITPDGTISGNPGTVTSINCVDGIIAAPNPITDTGTIALRPASNLLIGGVIVGPGLRVDGAGLLTLAADILVNGIAAWATLTNNVSAPVPTITLREGYNVSGVAYTGGPQPAVVITFQTPLPDIFYSVNSGIDSPDYAGSLQTCQVSNTVNFSAKTRSSLSLKVQSLVTPDNTTTGGTVVWNPYITGSPTGIGCFSFFDFQAFDTRVSPL